MTRNRLQKWELTSLLWNHRFWKLCSEIRLQKCVALSSSNLRQSLKKKKKPFEYFFSSDLFLHFVLSQFFEIFSQKSSWRSCEFFHLFNIFSNPNIWLRHQCSIKFSGARISSKTIRNLSLFSLSQKSRIFTYQGLFQELRYLIITYLSAFLDVKND